MNHVNMNARALSALLFSIVYRSSYTALLILCLFLLAVVPADHIYQTIANDRLGNVFVVGATVVVTLMLAAFIYFSRLYTNRTVLASIPRPYLPIEPGEVSAKVHRIITKNRIRSAIIAWDSRPRDVRGELSEDYDNDKDEGQNNETTPVLRDESDRTIFPVSAKSPPWGAISHPGWSDPANVDIPGVQFEMVVSELPNLVEAKAVSLAPPDPAYLSRRSGIPLDVHASNGDAPPDSRVVALLQRPSTMGLRDYLSRLQDFGLVDSPELADSFLAKYEYARFSGNLLTEDEFRRLLQVFSDLLSGMADIDMAALDIALSEASSETSSLASTIASSRRSAGSVRRLGSSRSGSSSRSSFRSVIVRHAAT